MSGTINNMITNLGPYFLPNVFTNTLLIWTGFKLSKTSWSALRNSWSVSNDCQCLVTKTGGENGGECENIPMYCSNSWAMILAACAAAVGNPTSKCFQSKSSVITVASGNSNPPTRKNLEKKVSPFKKKKTKLLLFNIYENIITRNKWQQFGS